MQGLKLISTLFLTGMTLTVAAAAAGDVQGNVRYDGPSPRRYPLQMDADPQCRALHGKQTVLSDSTLIGEGGELRNVFVYVKNPPSGAYPAPAEAARLEQQGCLYKPHVQGMRVNQELQVINDDPTLHNVRSMARENRPFNLGQPPNTAPRKKVFTKPESAIQIKCDVHSWMTAYIFVMEHPFYAVTDASGSYAIEGLPAGEYTLVAWHERYGTQELPIRVGESPLAEADFVFDEKSE